MKIYLEIEGILLTKQHDRAVDFADKFLQFILTHWPDSVYWLSEHCWRGKNDTIETLEPFLGRKTMSMIDLIQPTTWDELKTDGLDFKTPFLWYDTQIFPEEKKILKHYSAIDCLRLIDLDKQPLSLLDELVYLRSLA